QSRNGGGLLSPTTPTGLLSPATSNSNSNSTSNSGYGPVSGVLGRMPRKVLKANEIFDENGDMSVCLSPASPTESVYQTPREDITIDGRMAMSPTPGSVHFPTSPIAPVPSTSKLRPSASGDLLRCTERSTGTGSRLIQRRIRPVSELANELDLEVHCP